MVYVTKALALGTRSMSDMGFVNSETVNCVSTCAAESMREGHWTRVICCRSVVQRRLGSQSMILEPGADAEGD